MSNSNIQQQNISEATIRRFLLAQLSRREQSAFERALLMNPQLEQRARLAEIALIDDYVLSCLKASDRELFQKEFLVTTARRRKLEVSNALRQTFAVEKISQPARSFAQSLLVWPTFARRIAFAVVVLMVLFANALVIRKEPQIVERIIPKLRRPAAVVTPTPAAAHHPAKSVESPDHREETPQLPAHEAAPQMIVLRPGVSADDPTVIARTHDNPSVVRLELTLERTESGTFSIVVTTSSGEVVHHVPEIHVEDADRIDFDVQVKRLKAGDFQVKLTRINAEPGGAGTYYFRVP